MQGWKIFAAAGWPVTFRYPDPTPAGNSVRIDEHIRETGHRYHFVSEGSNEIYFEVGRSPGFSIDRAAALFLEHLPDAEAGEPEPAVVAGFDAIRFKVRWPEKRRWIHFLDVDGVTYRVILDPESPLNLAILRTLGFEL